LEKEMNSTRNVLLIGGAGYIGSALIGHLLENGYHVRCLDPLYYGNQRSILPYLTQSRFTFIEGEMNDLSALNKALQGATDVVLLAGLVGDPISKRYPDLSHRVNVIGVRAALDGCEEKGLDRVVFISTCSNYGLIEADVLAKESHELKPLSSYASAKVMAESYLLDQKGKVDYSGTVLRFATAFGLSPRMRFDLTVNEFTRTMYLGRELLVYDAETWRPYCHVQDFCTLIARVLGAPRDVVDFQIFNVGGEGNNCTKRMIVEAIEPYVTTPRIVYKEHGGDPRNYRVDFTKVRERLGFVPQWSVQDGVRELVDALENGQFADADANMNFYGNVAVSNAQ
jgi:nucleoside-diphosphate-sugar epimerase